MIMSLLFWPTPCSSLSVSGAIGHDANVTGRLDHVVAEPSQRLIDSNTAISPSLSQCSHQELIRNSIWRAQPLLRRARNSKIASESVDQHWLYSYTFKQEVLCSQRDRAMLASKC